MIESHNGFFPHSHFMFYAGIILIALEVFIIVIVKWLCFFLSCFIQGFYPFIHVGKYRIYNNNMFLQLGLQTIGITNIYKNKLLKVFLHRSHFDLILLVLEVVGSISKPFLNVRLFLVRKLAILFS